VKSLTTYFELNTLDHGVGYDSRSGHLFPLDEEYLWGLDLVWANSEPRSSTQWKVNELTEVFGRVYCLCQYGLRPHGYARSVTTPSCQVIRACGPNRGTNINNVHFSTTINYFNNFLTISLVHKNRRQKIEACCLVENNENENVILKRIMQYKSWLRKV
jgi:hypothetical protein